MPKARVDFPEPETPVTTVSFFFGITTFKSLRLCSRAPKMPMSSDLALRQTDCKERPMAGAAATRLAASDRSAIEALGS